MDTILKNKDHKIKYKQVAAVLEKALHSNEYEDGHQLPPERELADSLNVSVVTLRRSMALLVQKGLISRQRGRGTFVNKNTHKPAARQAPRKSTPAPKCIAHILIDELGPDPETSNNVYRHQVATLDSRLAQHNLHLVVSHATTTDLKAGKLPVVLSQNAAAGVILDGYVSDYHIEVFDQLDLPTIVLGAHRTHLPCTKASYDFTTMNYEICKKLFELDRGPVLYCGDAFRLDVSRMLFAGYSNACLEAGQDEMLYIADSYSRHHRIFRRMFDHTNGQFCLFLSSNYTYAFLEVLKEKGLNISDCPLVIHGALEAVPREIQPMLNMTSDYDDKAAATAVELIERMIRGEEVESVEFKPVLSWQQKDDLVSLHLEWHADQG